jgi:hypothetical protein
MCREGDTMEKILLVALPMLLAAPAVAQNRASQNYPVAVGPGLSSCQQYERLHHADPSMVDAYFVWAQGYMSGVNDRYIGDGVPTNLVPPSMSADDQKALLDRFCTAHLDASYMQGVIALLQQMRRDQGTPAAPPTPPAPPAPEPHSHRR